MNTKQDTRKLDLIGKEDLRRRIMRAVIHQGVSKAEAAGVFGGSRTSVHSWIDLNQENGEDGLIPKRPGRPKCGERLKGWQAATIVYVIKDHCPEPLTMPLGLWTREAVRNLIHMKFGVRYSLGMVGRLPGRWGFTPQKPVTRAHERNDERIRDWLERSYPVLRRSARRENAESYWEDETGLRSDHLVGRSYSPHGETPVIRNTANRVGCNTVSAENNPGKMRCRVLQGSFTQSVMIDFWIVSYPTRHVVAR